MVLTPVQEPLIPISAKADCELDTFSLPFWGPFEKKKRWMIKRLILYLVQL